MSFLKNNGFASASRDSVIAFIQPGVQNHGLKALFYVAAGPSYRFGDVNIVYKNAQIPSNEVSSVRYSADKIVLTPTSTSTLDETILVSKQTLPASINLTKTINLPTKN